MRSRHEGNAREDAFFEAGIGLSVGSQSRIEHTIQIVAFSHGAPPMRGLAAA